MNCLEIGLILDGQISIAGFQSAKSWVIAITPEMTQACVKIWWILSPWKADKISAAAAVTLSPPLILHQSYMHQSYDSPIRHFSNYREGGPIRIFPISCCQVVGEGYRDSPDTSQLRELHLERMEGCGGRLVPISSDRIFPKHSNKQMGRVPEHKHGA